MGRPSLFTDEIAEKIFDGLMDGKSLRAICLEEDMPNRGTIIRWMANDTAFATKCAHAREMQADLMDDMILETADATNAENAAANRVKISAYQWRASKLAPKRYGDRLDIDLTGNMNWAISSEPLSEEEWLKRNGSNDK